MLKLLLSKISFPLFILLVVLAACSSSDNQSSQNAPQATVLPTLTTIPMFNFVQPTLPSQIQTLAAATAGANTSTTATPEPGQQLYTTLACNTCHGDHGEGTDKGSALTSYTKSASDFISFLRSGGSVGSTHIYAPDRLTDADAKTLYDYLQSLVTK